MQHTVIAFFNTYPQAEAARDALVAAGIAHTDVILKARCEPTYASDATSAPAFGPAPAANEGLLASIERFFESLFVSAPPEREAAHYAEAVRRGAVMVCVDAQTDALAEVTRVTLEGMGPLDIEERAATWQAPADEATRSHSPLEELGLKSSVPVGPMRHGAVHTYAHRSAEQSITAHADETDATTAAAVHARAAAATEAAATAVAAGSAPGMGAVFTSGRSEPEPLRETPPAPPTRTSPARDESLPDEEVYRGDDPRSGPT